jgi:hypothetical protein
MECRVGCVARGDFPFCLWFGGSILNPLKVCLLSNPADPLISKLRLGVCGGLCRLARMNRCIVGRLLALVFLLLLAGCSRPRLGICEVWFSVIDGDTKQQIDKFTFSYPALSENNVPEGRLHRGEHFNLFFIPSSVPVTAQISAPGYSTSPLTIEPEFHESSVSPLPGKVVVVSIKKMVISQ